MGGDAAFFYPGETPSVDPGLEQPGKRVKDAPAAEYWASDPRGFGQVGCIYTAQGFEYDYGGVIIGPDMAWTGTEWFADPDKSADPVVRGSREFDRLVRNVYKVLLTRGLRGCAVYAVDPAARRMLGELIPGRAS